MKKKWIWIIQMFLQESFLEILWWSWPASDTQSLTVSVTSTEIQAPFAFGWTVRESI